jgi:putative addiction module component (TIGR02574 family)
MATASEIGMLALRLPESDRAKLAADLLDSLPGILTEDDDGLAEARRRSEEMDRDPSACLTHEEFLKAMVTARLHDHQCDPSTAVSLDAMKASLRSDFGS